MPEDSSSRHPRDVGCSVLFRRFPPDGYGGMYQDWLFDTHAEHLRGRVLDLGAEENQLRRYNHDSADISEYITVDLRPNAALTLQGDARQLPLEEDSVQTVILREVLEHVSVRELPRVVAEVERVLEPGGSLLLTTPFRFQIHGFGYTDHVRLTAQGLKTLLVDSGFKNVRVYKGGGFAESLLSPLQTAWFMLAERLGADWGTNLFALIHYPVIALGTLLNIVVKMIFGENIFTSNFYLHNMAIANAS